MLFYSVPFPFNYNERLVWTVSHKGGFHIRTCKETALKCQTTIAGSFAIMCLSKEKGYAIEMTSG
jgi:hypothetical protein